MKTTDYFYCISTFFFIVLLVQFPLVLDAQTYHARVSFIINSSDNIAPNNIYIAGSLPGMGPWTPNKIPLFKGGDGSWIGTIKMPLNTPIDIRFTQGNWNLYEADQTGEPIMHHFVLRRDTVIRHRVKNWSIPGQDYFPPVESDYTNSTTVTPPPPPKIIKPPFQFVRRHDGLESDGVNPRGVTVHLPKSYETDEQRNYPVLYVHDGMQRHYSTTSFNGNQWGVPQIAKSLMADYLIEDLIVVVIHNQNDYLFRHFSRNLNEPYRHFLTDKLKPFIDTRYRTLPEPENTCTMGSDFGGLWAFALAWENSSTIGKAICFSPIFEKPRQYFAYTFQVSQTQDYKNIQVYLDNGSTTEEHRKQDGMDRMIKVLSEKGIKVHYQRQFEESWNLENTQQRIKSALLMMF